VCFRYRNAETGKMERRTVPGAQFLWLVLQHVLPKGFRRARNFGFLHPNYKRLIALLHVLLNFAPGQATTGCKQRAPILCACCGALMAIVKTRIRSVCSRATAIPLPTEAMP
jgi:Putative transposase